MNTDFAKDGARHVRPGPNVRPGLNALQAQRGVAPMNHHGPHFYGEGYGFPGPSAPKPPFRAPNNRAPPLYGKQLPALPAGVGLPARPPLPQQHPSNMGRGHAPNGGPFPPHQRRPYNGVGQPDILSGYPHGGGGLNYG